MRHNRFLATLLVIGDASSVSAQQSSVRTPAADLTISSPTGLPNDSSKLAADISSSYYHPDGLSGLDCGAVLDFTSLLKQLGQPARGEPMKALSGMTIRVHAIRGQNPKIDIAWPQGIPANKENLEGGARQILNGFFQMYWLLFGSPLTPGPLDKFSVEAKAGGGHVLRSSTNNTTVTTEVDSDNVPTKFSIDSAAMKATIEPRFSPSQNPAPSDLRRLTAVDFSQQIGTNTMNVRITVDYQSTGGFNIPRHVSFNVGGAYSMPMEFIDCSAAKAAPSAVEPK